MLVAFIARLTTTIMSTSTASVKWMSRNIPFIAFFNIFMLFS